MTLDADAYCTWTRSDNQVFGGLNTNETEYKRSPTDVVFTSLCLELVCLITGSMSLH